MAADRSVNHLVLCLQYVCRAIDGFGDRRRFSGDCGIDDANCSALTIPAWVRVSVTGMVLPCQRLPPALQCPHGEQRSGTPRYVQLLETFGRGGAGAVPSKQSSCELPEDQSVTILGKMVVPKDIETFIPIFVDICCCEENRIQVYKRLAPSDTEILP